MDDLVVDSHLHTVVVDDEDADAATAVVERLGETGRKTALVKDRKALLDVASLGHGNNATVLTDVENTVLLEDRTKHVLDDDRGGRVGDEAGLLMELLGEEVDTEVAVLASLGGGGDADDLARAALKDQEVTDADVVAGDGDGVGGSHLADGCASGTGCRSRVGSLGEGGGRATVNTDWGRGLRGGSGDANDLLDGSTGLDGAGRGSRRNTGSVLLLDDYLFAAVVVLGTRERVLVRVVVVAFGVDGVGDVVSDLVGGFVDSLTKAVVLTLVVVISHITLELLGGVDSGTSSLFYSSLSWVMAVNDLNLSFVRGRGRSVLGCEGLLRVTLTGDDGTGAFTVLTFSHVNL